MLCSIELQLGKDRNFMPMPKQMVSFTRPQLDFLRDGAAQLGISAADFVRRMVDHYRTCPTSVIPSKRLPEGSDLSSTSLKPSRQAAIGNQSQRPRADRSRKSPQKKDSGS